MNRIPIEPLSRQNYLAPDMISVIIPTYNRADFLIELLDCLNHQTYDQLEIIVVDDGSTDDTFDRINSWMQSRSTTVHFFRQDNRGPAAARNTGLSLAHGEYIYFIDDDDYIFPNALNDMVMSLKTSGKPYCLASIKNSDKELLPIKSDFLVKPRINGVDIVSSYWYTHAALYRHSALDRAGRFNERLRIGEDSDYIWRIVAMNPVGEIIPNTIGLRRIHDQGHLWVGRTDVQLLHNLFEAYQAFFEWSVINGNIKHCIGQTYARKIFICIVDLAAKGDFKYIDCGRKILDDMIEYGAPMASMYKILLTPSTPYYYSIISRSFSTIKNSKIFNIYRSYTS